jgi:hypothetical protein
MADAVIQCQRRTGQGCRSSSCRAMRPMITSGFTAPQRRSLIDLQLTAATAHLLHPVRPQHMVGLDPLLVADTKK